MIKSLDLAIGLRMIRRREDVAYPQNAANILKEPGRELRSIVRQQFHRWSLYEYPVMYERLRYMSSGNFLEWYGPY